MVRWTYPTQHPKARLDRTVVFTQLTAESSYTLQCALISRVTIAPLRRGIWSPVYHMVPWAHLSPQPKRHLHRFGCFCRAHDRDGQTDGRTDLATPSVTIGRIYVWYCDAV